MAQSFEDPVLGRLDWDDQLDWWAGQVELFPNHRVELFVEPATDRIVEPDAEANSRFDLSRAREWVERVRRREPEYRAWSAAQLVESRWNKDDAMTAADIEELLDLATIECASDGGALLFWEDEDVLFAGHGLYTHVAADGTCLEVRMQ
jgi:hypothetical protein